MAQAQQQLSHKDGALFRQVVRHFENKQYKKGASLVLGSFAAKLTSSKASSLRNKSCGNRQTMPIHKP